MTEQRKARAISFIRDGCNINETATKLGYAHASSFCRKFPGLRKKAMEKPRPRLAQANFTQTANSFSQTANSF